jgi:hypothetical protein
MLADNNTPLAALGFEQWHPDGRTMAAVVARARLVLYPDGSVSFANKQDLSLADVFDADPHRSSMMQVGDLVPFRPAANITVRGSIHAAEPEKVLPRASWSAHIALSCAQQAPVRGISTNAGGLAARRR